MILVACRMPQLKNYVDNSTKKFYSGYIPILKDDFSMLGFMASSNVSSPFNNLKADGANGSWNTNTIPSWLQIQCPEPVKFGVALKANVNGSKGITERHIGASEAFTTRAIGSLQITGWNISASNNGVTLTTLLNSTTPLFGAALNPFFFNIPATTANQYYRFNITESVNSTSVKVQAMQLYARTK